MSDPVDPDGVLGALAAERLWEREQALEQLRRAPVDATLLDALADALHAGDDAERRNAARSALAALAAPGAAASPRALARLRQLVLADADPDVRVLAASALGESGNPAAHEPLARALADADENVAAAAADALGLLGAPEAVEPLTETLEHGGFWVRAAAVVALGRIGDARAVPALVRAMDDPLLAEAAATALGEIGDPAALEALRSLLRMDHPARETAILAAERILAARPETPAPAWLRQALRGREAELAERLLRGEEAAAHLLGVAGTDDAARRLVDALETPFAAAAAAALAWLPAEVAAAALVARLGEARGEARAALLAALPPLRSTAAVDAVVDCLADRHEGVRAAAVEALARCDEALVLPRLREALGEPATRLGAVRALAHVGDGRCEALAPLLGDADAAVREAAARGLARCATPAVRGAIAAALQQETEPGVRRALVEALGSAGGAAAVEQLVPFLAVQDETLHFAAVRALGQTRAAEALPPLLAALADARPEIQAAALHALGELGDPRAAEPVAARLEATDPDIRRTAAAALRTLAPPRALAYLERALGDPAWSVRLAAVRTLARIGAARAAPRLRELAEHDADPLVRDAAREAVARLEPARGEEDDA